VTYGVPAFRDRSGPSLIVNPRVSFEHAAEVAEFRSALRKLSRESRIVEESHKLLGEGRGIAGAKREAAFTEHL
jgi:hypothetical protein